jgi:HD-GYP domain-containing protein (c-di-GMP phosphodiesterase class II)
VGAALHDIGKIAIPDTILNKPGGLTDDEFTLVQGHVALGSEILAPVPFPPEVIEAVRFHHEKWNGTGYPHHLVGDSIPLVARIIAVADVYDALTSNRPYRPAWSHERALDHMRSEVGKHFNAEVFAAFEAALEENPQLATTAS